MASLVDSLRLGHLQMIIVDLYRDACDAHGPMWCSLAVDPACMLATS